LAGERAFRFRGEPLIMDAEARSAAPGHFVELADRVTHYELAGPPEGQPVVLVHGFSVPCYIWDPTFVALVDAGFRVLRYDLYGRGYSDRPAVTYDHGLYDRQLLDLISALDVAPPVDLIGLSMGGPICVTFADRHPERVRRLCLIDPAGFSVNLSLGIRLLRVPLLGEWILDRFGERMLISSLPEDLVHPERFPEYVERYRTQMRYAGFKRAILSTMRHGPIGDVSDVYRRVGRQKRRALLIWGREDRTVPFSVSEQVRAAMPNVEFHAIDEAGHIPHYECPDVVNPLLVEFLRP
jgi:pimeloyl-ACP methyl ester carboxylesterase